MKHLILFIVFIVSSYSFSQEIDPVETQFIWENHVKALLEKDLDLLVQHTEFPLITYMGELDYEDFEKAFEEILTEEILTELGLQTMNDFQPIIDETEEWNYALMIKGRDTLDNGEKTEFVLSVAFAKFDDVWKLYKIDITD